AFTRLLFFRSPATRWASVAFGTGIGLSLDNDAHFTPTHHQQQQHQKQQCKRGGGNMNMSGLFPSAHHLFENNMHPSQQHSLLHIVPQAFQGQPTTNTTVTVAHPPSIHPRVKVLSMNRLGGAGAVALLVFDVSLQSVEGDANENGYNQPAWENWSNNDKEHEVAKLMEEDVGAAIYGNMILVVCHKFNAPPPISSLFHLLVALEKPEEQYVAKSVVETGAYYFQTDDEPKKTNHSYSYSLLLFHAAAAAGVVIVVGG
nr:transcription factor UNE12-like [Tanacetum cinerariifolium]